MNGCLSLRAARPDFYQTDADPEKLNAAAARMAAIGCSKAHGGVRAGPDGTDPR